MKIFRIANNPNNPKISIEEGTRFFDPERNAHGILTLRQYHQTKVWMKLYDNGEIEELFNGDLKRLIMPT